MLGQESLRVLQQALEKLDAGFSRLPEFESSAPGLKRFAEVLAATAERLQDNYPYFHPLYAGQMLKPPHPVARAAYALAMWINPTIMRWMVDALRPRWKKKLSQKSQVCTGGRIFWATSAVAARWRTSRPCGLRGKFTPEKGFWPASRRITRMEESAECCNCRSNRYRPTRLGAWTSRHFRNGWSAVMSELSWQRWGRPQPVPWIHYRRFWRYTRSTDSGFMRMPPMAAILS